mmetsp:Transcript_6559/g.14253  ORF Transcript_6559/g.14253 Transcript_6559/m.14253 type:complete len:458 (-) Transcript_6559:317-1690(-)
MEKDWRPFAAGWTAGILNITVGHPLDTLKVRVQTGRALYTGGLRGLFAGIQGPLLTIPCIGSLNFGLYDTFRHRLMAESPRLFTTGGSSSSSSSNRNANYSHERENAESPQEVTSKAFIVIDEGDSAHSGGTALQAGLSPGGSSAATKRHPEASQPPPARRRRVDSVAACLERAGKRATVTATTGAPATVDPGSLAAALVQSEVVQECCICVEEQEPFSCLRLPCSHGWFCAECLRRHTSARLDMGRYDVPCPIPACGKELSDKILRAVLPGELLEKLHARSLDKAMSVCSDLYQCPTPDCPNRVALESGQEPRLNCSFCGRESCLKCGASPYHHGRDCASASSAAAPPGTDAEAEEKFRQWMKKTGTKQCPKCSAPVSKDSLRYQRGQSVECHKMICRNCQGKFCFNCLASLEGQTCGCTPNDHGFIDPTSGDFVEHRLARGSGRGGKGRGRGRPF